MAIFVRLTATTFSAPDASTRPSRAACASNGSAGGEIWRPVSAESSCAHLGGEVGVRVQTRADRGAAERDLAETLAAVAHPLDPLAHLRGVAGELLAEGDGHCVHQVRPARLDHVVELLGLLLQRRREGLEGGKQVVLDLAERGEMDGRGEDVVRALAHVDVVVRVHVVAGERRDHLVRVHVRARARPRLEDVDRKLVVVLALGDRVAGGGDPLGLLGVEQAEVGVRTRGGGLDPAEPAGDGNRNRLAGDREVRDRLPRLAAPKLALDLRAHGAEV